MLRALLAIMFGLGCTLAGGAGEPAKGSGFLKVEARGKLTTGIVAIGGETTGTTLTTPGGTLELDFGKNRDLRALAEKLNGKIAVVTGTLSIRKGIEVRQRLIVSVSTLKAAD
jgi:hypothetical protein